MRLAHGDGEGVELIEEAGMAGGWVGGKGLAGEGGKGIVSAAAGQGRGRR